MEKITLTSKANSGSGGGPGHTNWTNLIKYQGGNALGQRKKIVLLPKSPLYISDLWLGLYFRTPPFRGLESLTEKRMKQTETKAKQEMKKKKKNTKWNNKIINCI
jgi:hypothetical protein